MTFFIWFLENELLVENDKKEVFGSFDSAKVSEVEQMRTLTFGRERIDIQ